MAQQTRYQESVKWKTKYRDLLDSLNIAVVLFDMDYGCLEVNDTFLEMVGGNREQYEGTNARQWYSPEEFEELDNLVQKYERDLESHQLEYYVYGAGGQRIPVLFNASYNHNDKGRPESAYVLMTDIRETKRIQAELESKNQALIESRDTLEREKKKLEAILFGIGDCVTIFDPHGRLLLSNPKGIEIRGKRRTPLLPLKSGFQRELTLDIEGEKRRFFGKVEVIQDQKGETFAHAEILKDVSAQLKLQEQEDELFLMRRKVSRLEIGSQIIGVSPAMRRVFDLIVRCAEVDSTVLVYGESGVGKEMAARAIYEQSARKSKPFVPVNCGALPEPLLESELFGHAKGAFTGAVLERKGLFREAQGGVLLLDEVGDLPSPLQIKLLRALQEREIRPVGESKTYHVDVRVIATTNRKLEDLVKKGRFRRDLYYRLAVIPLFIPPLRERVEDILPLAEHFIKKHGQTMKHPARALHHAAQEILLKYSWPGNIRELENCTEHAIAMARGPFIAPEDLPVHIVLNQNLMQAEDPFSVSTEKLFEAETVSDGKAQQSEGLLKATKLKPWEIEEKRTIMDVFLSNKGNRARTAKALGISRTTLWRKMTLYQLPV